MSTSAQHSLFFVPEIVYGTTPATPAMKTLRHTGTTLGLSKTTHISEELRSDRQIADFRHGARQVGGDINYELSMTTFDDLIEAVMGGTWTTNVLKAGTTRRSFTMMRKFGDLQSADKPFHLFTGVELNNMSLSIPTDGRVTGAFTALGKDVAAATVQPTGTTYPAVTTTPVFDAFTAVLQEAGAALGIATEVTFNIENGLQPRFAIGSAAAVGQATLGRSNISGNITVFFQNATILEKFWSGTESSLSVQLVDSAAKSYTFLFPRIKLNGGQPDTTGQNGEIVLSVPFQALYDTVTGTNLQITRVP